jgi:CBS domain-containing protein
MAPLPEESPISPHDPIIRLVDPEMITVDEKLTLRSISAVLSAAEIGAAIVRRNGDLVGIVSERDVVRALAGDADPDTVWSADIMSEVLLSVEGDDAILRVAFRMIEEGIRHLAVSRDGHVVGLVSSRDVFAVLAEDALAAW